MAWIAYVPKDDVPEDHRVSDANIVRVSSVYSRLMPEHMALYTTICKRKSPVTRAQREMIATVVSTVNECFY